MPAKLPEDSSLAFSRWIDSIEPELFAQLCFVQRDVRRARAARLRAERRAAREGRPLPDSEDVVTARAREAGLMDLRRRLFADALYLATPMGRA